MKIFAFPGYRLFWALLGALLLPVDLAGQTAPALEKQKIEALIKQVGEIDGQEQGPKERPEEPISRKSENFHPDRLAS
jgi:hypothetical protein